MSSAEWLTHPAAARITIADAEAGRLEMPAPARKRLAIVGFAPHWREAPFEDPAWLIAGLNHLYTVLPRADLWFELHRDRADWDDADDRRRGEDYPGWLRACPVPVLMVERHDDIPHSVRYPIEAVSSWAAPLGPRAVWYRPQSSMALMLLWGLATGFEEIGIWGVDCAGTREYEAQRPNLEYWLGVARGRGVQITLAEGSALCATTALYGFDVLPQPPAALLALRQRSAKLDYMKTVLKRRWNNLDGAAAEVAYQLGHAEMAYRGAPRPASEGDWTPTFGIPDPEQEETR
jgi:hypothetical protein